jgi:hypothetical protein
MNLAHRTIGKSICAAFGAAVAMAFALAAQAQGSGVVGYNPGYYRPVTPPHRSGIPCGHVGAQPCPTDPAISVDAPEGLSGDQLVQFSNQQFARGDKVGAARTLARAADLGNVAAMRGLGMAFAYGHGITKDVPKGMRYLEQAAATGDAVALYHLGHIYGEGQVVERDPAKAARYLRSSAEKHFWLAEFSLGIATEVGQGTPHSREGAIAWFDRSARDTTHDTPALYAAYLRHAGAHRFSNGDQLAAAFWADYVRQHTAQASPTRGSIAPGSAEWINRITGNSPACYFGGAPGCPRR